MQRPTFFHLVLIQHKKLCIQQGSYLVQKTQDTSQQNAASQTYCLHCFPCFFCSYCFASTVSSTPGMKPEIQRIWINHAKSDFTQVFIHAAVKGCLPCDRSLQKKLSEANLTNRICTDRYDHPNRTEVCLAAEWFPYNYNDR